MDLTFPVTTSSPAVRNLLLDMKPEMIVTHLVGHEGAGSLISALKAKGWASTFQAATSLDVSDIQVNQYYCG
jgi:secreted Zn-dependent insulinase-like peptidase